MDKSLALRVASVFVVLAASTSGVCFPLVSQRLVPHFSSNNVVFSAARAFGAGVILATALIHILPEAVSVVGECFPDVEYPLAFALCLVAIGATLLLEQSTAAFFAARHRASRHNCDSGGNCNQGGAVIAGLGEMLPTMDTSPVPASTAATTSSSTSGSDSTSGLNPDSGSNSTSVVPNSASEAASATSKSNSTTVTREGGIEHKKHQHCDNDVEANVGGDSDCKKHMEELEVVTEERMAAVGHRLHHHHQHQHSGKSKSAEPEAEQEWIVAHILELGVALHSVIIGLALGTSTEVADVRALLIALSFHQFFEGIALGVCILEAKLSLLRTVIMVLIFSITTPIGIAVGIGVGSTNRTAEGVLESLAAGILLYMSLVDMVSDDFQKTGEKILSRFALVLAFLFGASAMAIIGMWA
ncbi:Zinc transporter 4 [Pelomyxa schiedti]|nr:Zinc transporter 4 [Pelomyxa schiedti]